LKVERKEDAKKNFKIVKNYIHDILVNLVDNKNLVPNSLKIIFQHLAIELREKFPNDENSIYYGISGFFFLRLICAAIKSPKLFDIMEDHPDRNTVEKTLLSMANILIKIANMVTLDKSRTNYQEDVDNFIIQEIPLCQEFIHDICIPNIDDSEFNPIPVDLDRELSALIDYIEEKLLNTIEKLYVTSDTIDNKSFDKLIEVLDRFAINQKKENQS